MNLRLFFESARYSEDMDLDGHPVTERESRGTEDAWVEMRLLAAALIQAILDERERE